MFLKTNPTHIRALKGAVGEFGVRDLGTGSLTKASQTMKTDLIPTRGGVEVRKFDITIG